MVASSRLFEGCCQHWRTKNRLASECKNPSGLCLFILRDPVARNILRPVPNRAP
jgi:hypothetical protein